MFPSKNTTTFAAVFLLSAVLWFGMLGHRDLFDSDEGRYSQISAAMVDTGDWLTPRLNGFKYFEKPALQYWGTATIFELLGKSNATARLWTAMMGFAMVFLAALVAYRLYGRTAALYTYLITISSMLVVMFGHIASLDMTLSTFVAVGAGCLVIAQINSPRSSSTRNWMLAAWVALALGTLTKGPVAVVLPLATMVVYSVWQRDFELWKKIHLFKGVLLYLLIVSPWFVAVSIANNEFAGFFFIHENLQRYTSEIHHRDGPVYYFVPILLLGLCPWLAVSLNALFWPGFKWIPENPGVFDAERFLWTFVVVTFIFFSLGQSKLPAYILPIMPIIAVLTGGCLTRKNVFAADFWIMGAIGIALLITALNIERLTAAHYPVEMWQSYQPWITASGLLFILAAVSGLARSKRPVLTVTAAALMSLAAIQLLILGFHSLSETRSGRVVAEVVMDSVPAGTPVFSFKSYSESSAFYLGAPVTIVDYSGELELGISAEPGKVIATIQEFLKTWKTLKNAALIANKEDGIKLNLEEMSARVVYNGPKKMVIIKP